MCSGISLLKNINRHVLLKHKNNISNIIRFSFEKFWSTEGFFLTKVKVGQLERGPKIRQHNNLTKNLIGLFSYDEKRVQMKAILSKTWECFQLYILFVQMLVRDLLQPYHISHKVCHIWLKVQAEILLNLIQKCSRHPTLM